MNKFRLKLHLPVDDNLSTVLERISYMSFKYTFWNSFVSPHKVEIEFEGLSDSGVDTIMDFVLDTYQNSPYRDYCYFVKESIK